MALLFHRPFRGRGALRSIFLFPMMATPVASMIGWRMMLTPDLGLFGLLTSRFGLPPFAPIASETWIIPTMAAIDTWQWTPFVALLVLAGLAVLPPEPFEAARIDGASAWQSFWYITLPLLRPFVVVAMLFRLIDTLKVFETIYVLTGFGTGADAETLNIYTFREGFDYLHMGYASALLVVFFGIILVVCGLLVRVRRSSHEL
jgi:multiple sugar transport system permease protein